MREPYDSYQLHIRMDHIMRLENLVARRLSNFFNPIKALWPVPVLSTMSKSLATTQNQSSATLARIQASGTRYRNWTFSLFSLYTYKLASWAAVTKINKAISFWQQRIWWDFFLALRLQQMNDLLETKACFASTTWDILIVVFTYRPLIIALSYNVSNLHEYQQ